MIKLEFTAQEIRQLVSTSEIIRDRVIALAELACQNLAKNESVIPEKWWDMGIRPDMIPVLVAEYGTGGNKIACIKKIREFTNAGLKESKDCAEEFIFPLVEASKSRGVASSFRVPDGEET